MKTEFRTKFLSHLLWSREDQEKGFTLIELCIVIIVLGCLSAIALPSFLSKVNKAKQAEGKLYVNTCLKGEQIYYAEKSAFTNAILDLVGTFKTQTANYTYSIGIVGTGTSATAICKTHVISGRALKNYAGMVSLVLSGASSDATSVSILCEQKQPTAPADDPTNGNTCNAASQEEVGG